jgi:hypothetical protein
MRWLLRFSGLVLLAGCLVAGGAETTWFGGTQRALPVSLAAPKEDGLRSLWAWTDNGDATWDFNLGTDVSVWQREAERCYQSVGPRFGVASRFQFNSGSFDLWAVDLRGGGAYGLQFGNTALEAFVYHESSHLGDEMLESGRRERIDSSVNGLRLTISEKWKPWLRTYGGLSVQPWAEPSELESAGLHAGLEFTGLPPWKRGYAAVDAEFWDWRDWSPDVTAQVGLCIGPRNRGKALEAARVFLEIHSGRVMLGQFYDETETYFAVGIGTSW